VKVKKKVLIFVNHNLVCLISELSIFIFELNNLVLSEFYEFTHSGKINFPIHPEHFCMKFLSLVELPKMIYNLNRLS